MSRRSERGRVQNCPCPHIAHSVELFHDADEISPKLQRLRANLQKLRIAGGLPAVGAPGPKNVYDAELAQWVTEFQRSHRLNVDGVAGIQTLVVLDTALASPGSPLLDAGAPPPGSG